MTKRLAAVSILIATFAQGAAYARDPGDPLKPGFNLFSKQQDIELGKEAAQQVLQQSQVVQNKSLQAYVDKVGQRLAQQPQAKDSGFQFTFTLLNDAQVNAFALPGGPMFIYTGLMKTVDNEGELAGVMAHEMSHVILRHGTHEATKQEFIQLPAMLAGSLAGSQGSLLGQLAQLGIGLGANSVLLKFSRDAESEADALGSHLMAEAGYDPIEMAHLFQKLESQGGAGVPQFLSDHPNPGNRVKNVQAEMKFIPQHNFEYSTGEFQQMKKELATLPAPPKPSTFRSGPAPAAPKGDISGYRQLQTQRFTVNVPSNWQVYGNQNSEAATVVPQGGIVQGPNGQQEVGFGAIFSYLPQDGQGSDLSKNTSNLISQMRAQNPNLRAASNGKKVKVDGFDGLITPLTSDSPFGGQEADQLLTVATKQGLFYLVFVMPANQAKSDQAAFDEMVRTLKFAS